MTETAADSITSVCRSGQMTETVVMAVAQAKGVDPLDLEPLYNVVDPDALNRMFDATGSSPPASVELTFSMAGCQVVVRGDGEVAVTPLESDESQITITRLEE